MKEVEYKVGDIVDISGGFAIIGRAVIIDVGEKYSKVGMFSRLWDNVVQDDWCVLETEASNVLGNIYEMGDNQ
jgi:hypothetical protein